MLKNVLLELITVKDATDSHAVILDHFSRATTANDRISALVALNRSSAPERLDILEEAYGQMHSNISGYANYLRVIAGGTCEDVFDQIERERNRPTFQITQPTWCRALFLTMANNNKMIWNERGVNWIADRVIELARINYTNAGRMLNTFQHVRKMKPESAASCDCGPEAYRGGSPGPDQPCHPPPGKGLRGMTALTCLVRGRWMSLLLHWRCF